MNRTEFSFSILGLQVGDFVDSFFLVTAWSGTLLADGVYCVAVLAACCLNVILDSYVHGTL
jgi:hypothetical protein